MLSNNTSRIYVKPLINSIALQLPKANYTAVRFGDSNTFNYIELILLYRKI